MFMPVGTHGAVKGVSPSELAAIGSQTILANTYHLYLRPGEGIVQNVGGLHPFMGWRQPILTDSGGFQVFSLGERGISGSVKKAMRRVTEEGIRFSSHLDGSEHIITPERSIQIQQALGADIIMAFDQPVYGMSEPRDAEVAMERTHRWLERSIAQWRQGTDQQALFGIVQGGQHFDLHRRSAEFVVSQDLPGNAIGGLAIGESKAAMWAATDSICALLPGEKPRYFMGLGDPLDLIEATARGVDMYDCVAPARLARHGVAWLLEGENAALEVFWAGETEVLLNLRQRLQVNRQNMLKTMYRDDPRMFVGSSRMPADLIFPYAALSHFLRTNEMLGYRVLTLHNLALLHQITEHMRQAIRLGRFRDFAALFGIEY